MKGLYEILTEKKWMISPDFVHGIRKALEQNLNAPMMTDSDGLPLQEPKTPQMVFTMQLPHPVPPLSFLRHAVDLGGK